MLGRRNLLKMIGLSPLALLPKAAIALPVAVEEERVTQFGTIKATWEAQEDSLFDATLFRLLSQINKDAKVFKTEESQEMCETTFYFSPARFIRPQRTPGCCYASIVSDLSGELYVIGSL